MKNYHRIIVYVLMTVGTLNNSEAQKMTYVMSYSHGFFSIEPTNSKNPNGISIYLKPCDCYSMQVFGDKIILGTEKYQDFIANQKTFITKYQEKVNSLGYYDSTVAFKIDKTEPSKVVFYYYKTAISGTIPTGKFALSEGYYNVEIFENEFLRKKFTISIKNNTITKL
jgi:hypothetical protein